jgi:hypothetical protein
MAQRRIYTHAQTLLEEDLLEKQLPE